MLTFVFLRKNPQNRCYGMESPLYEAIQPLQQKATLKYSDADLDDSINEPVRMRNVHVIEELV